MASTPAPAEPTPPTPPAPSKKHKIIASLPNCPLSPRTLLAQIMEDDDVVQVFVVCRYASTDEDPEGTQSVFWSNGPVDHLCTAAMLLHSVADDVMRSRYGDVEYTEEDPDAS